MDFDGTVCTHEYPAIGKDAGAIPVLLKLQKAGAKICLNTLRTGAALDEAVQWLDERGVRLHGINRNPDAEQWARDNGKPFSTKVHADCYIDDKGFGVPLKQMGDFVVVDWEAIDRSFLL